MVYIRDEWVFFFEATPVTQFKPHSDLHLLAGVEIVIPRTSRVDWNMWKAQGLPLGSSLVKTTHECLFKISQILSAQRNYGVYDFKLRLARPFCGIDTILVPVVRIGIHFNWILPHDEI